MLKQSPLVAVIREFFIHLEQKYRLELLQVVAYQQKWTEWTNHADHLIYYEPRSLTTEEGL